MAVFITDPVVEDALLAERSRTGASRYDEVWDGVYWIPPLPTNEQQRIVARLTGAFLAIFNFDPGVNVFAGIDVSDQEDDWTQNYRVPDVAVFLEHTRAEDRCTHWLGGPDFGVEVESSHDRAREKLPFYAQVGVRELLLISRGPWAVELFRLQGDAFTLVGKLTLDDAGSLESTVLGVRFRLLSAAPHPMIEIRRLDGSQQWRV